MLKIYGEAYTYSHYIIVTPIRFTLKLIKKTRTLLLKKTKLHEHAETFFAIKNLRGGIYSHGSKITPISHIKKCKQRREKKSCF